MQLNTFKRQGRRHDGDLRRQKMFAFCKARRQIAGSTRQLDCAEHNSSQRRALISRGFAALRITG